MKERETDRERKLRRRRRAMRVVNRSLLRLAELRMERDMRLLEAVAERRASR